MADGTAFFSYTDKRNFVRDNDPGRTLPESYGTGRLGFTRDGGKSYTFMDLPGEPADGGIQAIETDPGVLLVIYGMRYNCYNGDLRAMLVRPNFETHKLEPLPLDDSSDPLSIRLQGPI